MRSSFSLSVIAALVLSACGGGSNTTSRGGQTVQPTATAISGVVATGAAVPNAAVTVTDRTGHACGSASSDSTGEYTVNTTNCTAPVQITAAGLTSITTTLSAHQTVNVTTLTTALTKATLKGATWDAAATQADLSSALDAAKAQLTAQLQASNVNLPSDFDLVHTSFKADGTGVDAAMDRIEIKTAQDGSISLVDKVSQQELIAIDPSSGNINSTTGGKGLWPNYHVFAPLTSTVRELASNLTVTPDDTTTMTAVPNGVTGIGVIKFDQGTESDIVVTDMYDSAGDGGIGPLSQVTGNERLLGQVVINCTNPSAAYVMLSKAAEIVPLSTLTSGGPITMEELGVSESCPLQGSASGPLNMVFSGSGGTVSTPMGTLTATEWAAVNASGTDRFLAFRVMVEGVAQYGLIERGLDDNGHPFMFIHVQVH